VSEKAVSLGAEQLHAAKHREAAATGDGQRHQRRAPGMARIRSPARGRPAIEPSSGSPSRRPYLEQISRGQSDYYNR
jgi:hypothetical protein